MLSSLLLTVLLWPLSHAEKALQLDVMEGEKPVTKVVSLLETMTQKLEEDQKADEELKEKFECWCKQNNEDKSAAVAAAQEKLASLNALVEELGPKIDQLGTQIRSSNVELNQNKADSPAWFGFHSSSVM
ncbi:unnamed protein product [Symbiodinium sp. CCMP2592]|nr:unnamed protein product [Symbiodinium sp. CCMP2592]